MTYKGVDADDAQLSFDESEVTSVPDNNAFVAPTLNNPLSLAITYSSSDEDLALVDENTGVVALGDAEGDVTITAETSAAGYTKNTQASYTIHLVKGEAELAYATTTFEVIPGGDFDAPTLTNPHSLDVTYASSDENVAVVDENTGYVVIGDEGTATITATFAGNTSYKAGSASYTISVGKMSAGLSFATTSFSVAIGETFDAPILVNPNDLTVTYSTTDADVADVNASTGAITIGTKEGTATITASFAGNAQYNAGDASYTITVEKVESTTLTTVNGSQNDGVSNDYFTLTFTKNTGTAPAWNAGDNAVRAYAKNTITVASKNGETIKSITINGVNNSCAGITANPAGTANLKVSTAITWTAATDHVTSVVFTIGGTSGNYAVKSVDVKYYPVEGVVAAPTFSEEEGEVAENTEIELTATDGCTIVYTTDETDPTYAGGAITNGTAYTAPIPVTGPITIKAIAVDASGNYSEVASRSYYLSGETKTEIDLCGSLSSITFNAPGANISGSGYQTATIAMQGNDGNSYSGWKVTNGLKSNTTMQLQASSGKVVSPTIKSDYGFTIALTFSQGSASISDGTSSSSTGTLTTTKTETTITIKASSSTTVLTRIVITPLDAPVAISDVADYTPEAKNGVNVTLTRDFVEGWNGIVLPFDLTDAVKTALGATAVKTLGTADYDAGDVTLNFTDATLPVAAGTPVLVKLSAAKSSVSVEGVAIKTTAPQTVAMTAGGSTYTLKGTYSNVDEEATELYFVSGSKFYHKAAGVALTLKPFRAYIVQEANGAAPARTVNFNLDGENTTGIESVHSSQFKANSFYNLNGQRVAAPQKGLFIVNGKKVVVK